MTRLFRRVKMKIENGKLEKNTDFFALSEDQREDKWEECSNPCCGLRFEKGEHDKEMCNYINR